MDSDNEEPRFSVKRKKLIIESSSDESDENASSLKTPQNKAIVIKESGSSSTRSSSRIARKRNQSFEMPSRDTVWKSIPSAKSSDKYHHLSPRKLVNNFTRENHRYNYDPNYTSGEESMDDFIVDSDIPVESSSGSDSDSQEEEQTTQKGSGKKRVINYKKRVIVDDSDSDCEITDTHKNKKQTNNEKTETRKNVENDKSTNIQSGKPPKRSCKRELENSGSKTVGRKSFSKTLPKKSKASGKTYNVDSTSSDSDSAVDAGSEAQSSDEDVYLSKLTPRRKRCKSSVLQSDDEDDMDTEKQAAADVIKDVIKEGVSIGGSVTTTNSSPFPTVSEEDKGEYKDKLNEKCNKSDDGIEDVKEENINKSADSTGKTSGDLEHCKKQALEDRNKSETNDSGSTDIEINRGIDNDETNDAGKQNEDKCVDVKCTDMNKEKIKDQSNDSESSETDSESHESAGNEADDDSNLDEPGTSKGNSTQKNKPKNANNSLEVLRKLVKDLNEVNYDTYTSESGTDREEEDSEGTENSGTEASSEPEDSDSKARLVKKKKAKLELFQKFREARERKLSKDQKNV